MTFPKSPHEEQDNSHLKNSHDEVKFHRKVEHISLALPRHSYFLIPGCPRSDTGKKIERSIFVHPSRATLSHLARYWWSANRLACAASRYAYKAVDTERSDTEERVYKGSFEEGNGRTLFQLSKGRRERRQPFRFVAGKYSIFLAIGKGSSFSLSRRRGGGEIWRRSRKARRMRGNDGLGWRRLCL